MILTKNAFPFLPSFLFKKVIFNLGHFSELVFSTIIRTLEVSGLGEEQAVARGWKPVTGLSREPKSASQLQLGHQDTPTKSLAVPHSLAHTMCLNLGKSAK